MDWGKAFQVAVIGLSGVFFGLILLQLCVNIFGGIFRIAERFGAKKILLKNGFQGISIGIGLKNRLWTSCLICFKERDSSRSRGGMC